MNLITSWQFWAILSALFAALTAIFAKVGVTEMDSNLATFMRTVVILCVLGVILIATDKLDWAAIIHASRKGLLFLLFSGMATGASWLCYFRALSLGEASKVAPIDKLSVVFVALLGTALLGEELSALSWVGVVLIGVGAVVVALG
ncbi:MAG: EamA family transporter [Caldilineaceae bacterium]|nr:EamA family transporter [Caldilineaceae bacterium]